MEPRRIFPSLFSFLCLVATALGLINVYADNSDVRRLAEQAACGAPGCSVSIPRQERSVIEQTFTFQTRLIEKGKTDRTATIDVSCRRDFVLVGSYVCNTATSGTNATK